MVNAFLASGARADIISSSSPSTRSVRWCAVIPGGQTTSAKRRATRLALAGSRGAEPPSVIRPLWAISGQQRRRNGVLGFDVNAR
jgi:hypothetical protein